VKGVAGATKIALLDPIEVYYLPREQTFYPIISKSGCSSIKLMLIRRFKPDYDNVFPGIHDINPAKITNNNLQRLFFKTVGGYTKWTRGKNMVFVMREPISRFYSCYLDVLADKNIMYKYPSGLDWAFKFHNGMSFDDFSKYVLSIPDYLSDRHFRSQCFYLSPEVKENLSNLEAITLKEYMQKNNKEETEQKSVKLNTNNKSIPDELRAKLAENQSFQNRFKADLLFYKSI